MTFWCRSGSGTADPCLCHIDPDPVIFVIDLQGANKKIIEKNNFSAYYLLKVVHLHNFSKIRSKKSQQTGGIKVFLFLLDDRRIRIRIHTSD
jgi:hypothetical protein